jgi:hypothetical protein
MNELSQIHLPPEQASPTQQMAGCIRVISSGIIAAGVFLARSSSYAGSIGRRSAASPRGASAGVFVGLPLGLFLLWLRSAPQCAALAPPKEAMDVYIQGKWMWKFAYPGPGSIDLARAGGAAVRSYHLAPRHPPITALRA